MAGSQPARRLYLPSLAAELAEGWTVSEGATFASPSGTEIHLRLNRAPEHWETADLAAQMEEAARAEVVGIGAVAASTVSLRGGRNAHERRFECDRDGVASIGRILCLVEGGLALTASASWPSSSGGAAAEMDDALASVRLLSRPVVNVRTAVDGELARPPAKRVPVDPSVWMDLRSAWATSPSAVSEVHRAARWSAAELAVCATILGASSFPTVGAELLGSLPEVGLTATLDAVTRSLVARGLVRAGEDGSAALSDDLNKAMVRAVFPDLTILVERLGGPGNGRWWFGLRPDSATQVTVLPDGSREMGNLEPGDVIPQLFALTGTGLVDTQKADVASDRITLDEITRGSGRVASLVRVSTAWRVGELIRGGVLTWALGLDGSYWFADPDFAAGTPTWDLRSTDFNALRAEVLDHLPGA